MNDPNADLIGITFTTDAGIEIRVLHTPSWSSQYVVVCQGGSLSVRSAEQVRTAYRR